MKGKFLLPLIAATIAFAGCGTIREHRALVQPQNQKLTASVGSTLFRLNKRGDLPNAYGGRDIYGGKVDKGYAEVKLRAVRDSAVVELVVFDVSRDSSETTMDRYRPLARIDVSQTVNVGGGGSGGIPVTLDTRSEREFVVSDVKITFLEVRQTSVTYTISDLQSSKR